MNGKLQVSPCSWPTRRKKVLLTYSQWQKAFYIYATVWAQVYPPDFLHLLKYADTIRELYVSQARWQYYDEQFRRTRAIGHWPWQSLQMELWGKAMTISHDCDDIITGERVQTSAPTRAPYPRASGSKHINNQPSASATTSSTPTGYCWTFHRGDTCRGRCDYDHRCHHKCEGNHRECHCPNSNKGNGRQEKPHIMILRMLHFS